MKDKLEFINDIDFKIPKRDELTRRMVDCVIGAFQVGYELGRLEEKEKLKDREVEE